MGYHGGRKPLKEAEVADKAMDVYLNDHLAGAMFGSNLAEQIRDRNEGTALGHVMRSLADEIKADQQTLSELMDRIGTAKNPVKQASTWIAEKATRAKFRGHLSGEAEVGTFMALETLALGVEGKASLWRTLKAVSPEYPELASLDLTGLINRAEAQRSTLEDERLAAGTRALADHGVT
jgi:hypothetical protein